MRSTKSRRASSHPHPRHHNAGTLPDQEPDELPVTEAGLSVEPEDLGRQFLRDATEQDNFESSVPPQELDPQAAGLAQIVSQSTLEASNQEEVDLPGSAALGTSSRAESVSEPTTGDVDVRSNSIRGGSLFDQPTERGGFRVPHVHADEFEVDEGPARAEAMREELAVLKRYRPRLDGSSRKPGGTRRSA